MAKKKGHKSRHRAAAAVKQASFSKKQGTVAGAAKKGPERRVGPAPTAWGALLHDDEEDRSESEISSADPASDAFSKRVVDDKDATNGGAPPGSDSDEGDDDDTVGGALFSHRLADAVDVLNLFVKGSEMQEQLRKDKKYKPLRKVLFELNAVLSGCTQAQAPPTANHSNQVVAAKNEKSDVARVTECLENGCWELALPILKKMKNGVRERGPKLGAMQRWVRLCDAAGGIESSETTRVLDAIFRCSNSFDIFREHCELSFRMVKEQGTLNKKCGVRSFKNFVPGNSSRPGSQQLLCANEDTCDLFGSILNGVRQPKECVRKLVFPDRPSDSECAGGGSMGVCWREKGASRKPANKHDLQIYCGPSFEKREHFEKWTNDGLTLPLSPQKLSFSTALHGDGPVAADETTTKKGEQIRKEPVPHVPGAFYLTNVLSAEECDTLIASAEACGYSPDEPLGGQPGKSILAHACVWLMPEFVNSEIFERCEPFLPKLTSYNNHNQGENSHKTSSNENAELVVEGPGETNPSDVAIVDCEDDPYALSSSKKNDSKKTSKKQKRRKQEEEGGAQELEGSPDEKRRKIKPERGDLDNKESRISKTSNNVDVAPSSEVGSPISLNRRWRFYRYVPGRHYRPHIDGAWPPSGLGSSSELNGLVVASSSSPSELNNNDQQSDGTYVYDASNGTELSKLTFLIYLNEDFEGGETTFFVPSVYRKEEEKGPQGGKKTTIVEEDGVLNAFPVRPRRGGVLVFPHGDTQYGVNVLHEGSPVLQGAKYVIRTEVLYPFDGRRTM